MLTRFNAAESAVATDISSLCKTLIVSNKSAIDDFYLTRNEVIQWAYQQPFNTNVSLRASLLIILFSAAETYFRRILSEVLSCCPIAKESAAQQQIPIGVLTTLGIENIGLAIADTRGLTSSGEIITRTKNLLGLPVEKGSSLGVAIEEFERFCNFRHSIAHSNGELLYNNRRELKIKATGRVSVSFDNKGFQDVTQIVVNVVRAYNNHIGNEILIRWFASGHLVKNWQTDKQKFNHLFSLFSSTADANARLSSYQTYLSTKKIMQKKA